MFQLHKVVLAVVSLLLWHGALLAAPNPFIPKMPLEEGIVHYRVGGSVHGERILYLKNYGKYQALFSKTDGDLIGSDTPEERLRIVDEEWVTEYDFTTQNAKRHHRLAYLLAKKFAALPPASRKRILTNLKKAGSISPEDLLERRYRCERKIKGFEGYMVEKAGENLCKSQQGGMLLQSSIDILGYHVTTILSGIKPCRLKEGYFTLPAGIHATLDTEAESRQMKEAERILQLLKKEGFQTTGSLLPPLRHQSENLHLIIEEGIRSLERML